MRNWKSLLTWLMFAIAFNYSVYDASNPEIVWYTGLFTLIMGVVFVFRNDLTKDVVHKLIDKLGRS